MSVARTARRRRKQYALGKKGLEQIFGKRAAPNYRKRSAEALAIREANFREKQKVMAGRKKK